MLIDQLLELGTWNELENLMENATESLQRRAPPCFDLRQPDSTETRRYFSLPSQAVLDRCERNYDLAGQSKEKFESVLNDEPADFAALAEEVMGKLNAGGGAPGELS